MKSTSIKALSIILITIIFGCSSEKEAAKTLPQLTTTTATSVTLISASTGGNVSADGGAPVTSRGVVWNNATAPTISLVTKTTDGTGTGSFTSSIANLIPSTNYYARAYATNSVGTAYGNEITFTTGAVVLPTLTTLAATSITINSAISGGAISSDGGGAITARGLVWSTLQNPTIALTTKTTETTSTGNFTSAITGLSLNTTYYVKAYATNSVGTAYGNQVSFTTLTPMYASLYPSGTVFCNNVVTAVIDVTNPVTGKTWMDRNLGATRVATSQSDELSFGDLYQWGRGSDGHQCRNSQLTDIQSSSDQPSHANFITRSTNENYGNWRSTNNQNLWQGVNGINNPCPIGYRLPSPSELDAERLTWISLGTDGAFASTLKLPKALLRDETGYINTNPNLGGNYWSSNGSSILEHAYYLDIKPAIVTAATAEIKSRKKASGLSVRCIKN